MRVSRVSAHDGLSLHLVVLGGGNPVVIVPGSGGYEHDLASLARGRSLACYHSRNRGLSELTDDPDRVGLQWEVDDLEAVREHLEAERCALIGHSYNGAVVARYAMQHPDRVERMLLLSTLGPRGVRCYEAADPVRVARARTRLEALSSAVPEPGVRPPTETSDRQQRSLAHVLREMQIYDWRTECTLLMAPSLVISGESPYPLRGDAVPA